MHIFWTYSVLKKVCAYFWLTQYYQVFEAMTRFEKPGEIFAAIANNSRKSSAPQQSSDNARIGVYNAKEKFLGEMTAGE